jgi:prepilin-type N-terminal cleavage/methylation domain-containing protein
MNRNQIITHAGAWRSFTCPAFTLIELLVTLAIIRVVSSLVIPAVMRGASKAKSGMCVTDHRVNE